MARNLPQSSVDVLFKNQATLKAVNASQKFQSTNGDTRSIMSLIRKYYIITSAKDSLKFEKETEEDMEPIQHMVKQSP